MAHESHPRGNPLQSLTAIQNRGKICLSCQMELRNSTIAVRVSIPSSQVTRIRNIRQATPVLPFPPGSTTVRSPGTVMRAFEYKMSMLLSSNRKKNERTSSLLPAQRSKSPGSQLKYVRRDVSQSSSSRWMAMLAFDV